MAETPDVEGIPPEEKWRAEVIVAVTPDDARVEPFQAPAHDTLQGQFSTVKEFQEQWLDGQHYIKNLVVKILKAYFPVL